MPRCKARDGDSELAGREVGIEVGQLVPGELGSTAARLGERVELRRTHLYQRELGGDEEAVEGDQKQAQGEAEPGAHAARSRLRAAGALRKEKSEDRHSGEV